VFSRIRLAFQKFWLAIVLLTLMLLYYVIVIPRYILFISMGLINMRDVAGMNLNFLCLPLILPKLFATDAFFIFLLPYARPRRSVNLNTAEFNELYILTVYRIHLDTQITALVKGFLVK